ncbi:unnamed protein product, partial [Rotaria sp. Silwood2]
MNSNDRYELSTLPDNALSLKGDEFYKFIQSVVGEPLHDILKIQLIDSTQSFLDTKDIFEIFKYDSPDLFEIKAKSCFKINGEYVIKAGIKNSLTYLMKLLKTKQQKLINNNKNTHRQISYELLNKNPVLRSLIDWYEENENTNPNNNSNVKQSFLSSFIDNITNNLSREKRNYQYSESVKRFALLLYILGGKLTYELLRINLVGALPSLVTLNRLILNSNNIMNEGEFQFDTLKQYLNSNNVQFGFVSEDCTGVIRKIQYDVRTNSFIGFSTPLDNGIPISQHYKTDSFETLKTWFSSIKKAPLLNIHMFQPLPSNRASLPNPFLLSAYGVENTFTANDILRRWLFIYEGCIKKQIRIIGFSSGKISFFKMHFRVFCFSIDADGKYMRAMRLVSGFFASLPNFKLHQHPNAFKINLTSEWPWFYLRQEQLFLFLQDATHLATKWRNRLLSSTAQLCIGEQIITIEHLQDIIDNDQYTKLDHNLIRTDLNPKDRQNYRSCERLASDDVLNLLKMNTNTQGTFVYLQLLQLIIIAYIEPTTPLKTRLKSAWITVFVCRLWLAWLKKKIFKNQSSTSINKDTHFITRTAYLSVELNAHNLLYLILLVQQQQLPKESLHIFLFNSQSCEGMFRNARSLSGAYSTIVNFTTHDFLRRVAKLSLLNQIKCDELTNQSGEHISFPIHHKRKADNALPVIQELDDVDYLDIEQVILESYEASIELIENLGIATSLKKHQIYKLEKLSKFMFNELNSKSRVSDSLTGTINIDDDMSSESDDNEYENNNGEDNDYNNSSDEDEDAASDNEENVERIQSVKTIFSGTRIKDKINPDLANSYFRVKINDTTKFLHKQSAVWLLTDKNDRLSTDRLSRVMEGS